jgi:hypothetical protein
MSEKKSKFGEHKDHLNKTYLEELGKKIWATKGARFKANKRLLVKADLSNRAIGFLSAYLIIFGLISLYQNSNTFEINSNIIAFGTTAISILLLLFSQMESAQDYKIKAHQFHICALALGEVHNKIRIFKTLENYSDPERISFCKETSKEYQDILNLYSNHDEIDFKTFQIMNREDEYTNLNFLQVCWIEVYYYLQTKMIYHLLIVVPPIIILSLLIV